MRSGMHGSPPLQENHMRSGMHGSPPLHLLSYTLPLSFTTSLPPFGAQRSPGCTPHAPLPTPPVPCRCVSPTCRRPA